MDGDLVIIERLDGDNRSRSRRRAGHLLVELAFADEEKKNEYNEGRTR